MHVITFLCPNLTFPVSRAHRFLNIFDENYNQKLILATYKNLHRPVERPCGRRHGNAPDYSNFFLKEMRDDLDDM